MKIETEDAKFTKLFEALVEVAPTLVREITEVQAQPTLADLVDAVKRSAFEYPALKPLCLAQWMVESARGTSKLFKEYFNAGGMKFRTEMIGYATPVEYVAHDGLDTYCAFESLDAWIKGYWRFISRPVYAGWTRFGDDPKGYITHLKSCGYAEDPNYVVTVLGLLPEAEKLLGITPAKLYLGTLDPGHSETEPGARSNTRTAEEEDLNRLQASIVKERCAKCIDFEVFDPQVDNLETIGQRAKGKHVFISLHHNSYKGSGNPGAEIFTVRGANPESKALAQKVLNRICEKTGDVNRGVKEMNYTVIAEATDVCAGAVILVESYFLNMYNKTEAEKRSAICAEAIAEVLCEVYSRK